jgi:hypothetical protein
VPAPASRARRRQATWAPRAAPPGDANAASETRSNSAQDSASGAASAAGAWRIVTVGADSGGVPTALARLVAVGRGRRWSTSDDAVESVSRRAAFMVSAARLLAAPESASSNALR